MNTSTALTLAGMTGNLLRAAVLSWLLVLAWADWPATETRDALRLLPDQDFAAEAEALMAAERFDEAALVIEAGLEGASAQQAWRLRRLQEDLRRRREDPVRRLREFAHGAVTGEGESGEALTGAVIADLLVYGDVRDLVVQGERAARGEQADPVIVGLSVAGLLLTAAPAMDLGTALLKAARRLGALGDRFAAALLRLSRRAVRQGRSDELAAVVADVGKLGEVAGPQATVRMLRHVDDPADLARAARFVDSPASAYVLYAGGQTAFEWLRVADKSGHRWLRLAARKGAAGFDLLRRSGKALLRPHPWLGLLKGLYKGTVPELWRRFLERYASALFGALSAWLLVEVLVLFGRARRLLPGAAQSGTRASIDSA